ncbi:hypothetical protein QW180_20270 [Vibrio sinaloensis]|nr:hypothetical protein [Vibrio sinaloensis]
MCSKKTGWYYALHISLHMQAGIQLRQETMFVVHFPDRTLASSGANFHFSVQEEQIKKTTNFPEQMPMALPQTWLGTRSTKL